MTVSVVGIDGIFITSLRASLRHRTGWGVLGAFLSLGSLLLGACTPSSPTGSEGALKDAPPSLGCPPLVEIEGAPFPCRIREDRSHEQRILDARTHLIWQHPPLDGMLPFMEALDYCRKLEWGGQKGWRLPTITELRTLLRRCPTTISEGECRVHDPKCLSPETCFSLECRGCPTLSSEKNPNPCYLPDSMNWPGLGCRRIWSASLLPSGAEKPSAYTISFLYGSLGYDLLTDPAGVRCVRPADGTEGPPEAPPPSPGPTPPVGNPPSGQ